MTHALLGGCVSSVHSVENLLSALECCGVDNARIEMEGGYEVPVVDGSAQGWAMNVMVAGLQPAHSAKGKGTRNVHARAPRPSRVRSPLQPGWVGAIAMLQHACCTLQDEVSARLALGASRRAPCER